MNSKQLRISALETKQSELLEDTDGADIFLVLNIFADEEDMTCEEAFETRFFKSLLQATQSNPERAAQALREAMVMDFEISMIDSEPED